MARGGVSKPTFSMSDNGEFDDVKDYDYKEPLHEKAFFHYTLLILVIISLGVSIFSFVSINKLTGAAVAEQINANEFLQKLTAHEEVKNYASITPLNILQVTQNNLAGLQTQINGLDMSYIGNFIVQYSDRLVIYDYNNDVVRGIINLQPQAQLPDEICWHGCCGLIPLQSAVLQT